MSSTTTTTSNGGNTTRTLSKKKKRNRAGGGNGTRNNTGIDGHDKENRKNGFKGQLQDSCFKGIVITDNTNNRPTQFKKLMDALPTYCADKDYEGLIEILCDRKDWDDKTFFSKKPNSSQWSEKRKVKVAMDEHDKPIMLEQVFITDQNLKE